MTDTPLKPCRDAFLRHFAKNKLDFTLSKDAWGGPKYSHSYIQALWEGWEAAWNTRPQPDGVGEDVKEAKVALDWAIENGRHEEKRFGCGKQSMELKHLIALSKALTKPSVKCTRCNDTGKWYGGVDGHLEYECDHVERTAEELYAKLMPKPSEAVDVNKLTVEDYEEVLKDHRRLVRKLDVLLNGEGAAEQASLCDIVCQVAVRKERGLLRTEKDVVSDNEWFFRWIARGKGGHTPMDKAIEMIWCSPDNPYAENNPWQVEAAEKEG